jgi:putative glycerol-1-phosphate prenyltransferase
VGGSLVADQHIHELIPYIKSRTSLPEILFPGSTHQIVPDADGILFLSLISGRNPDLLIGRHVEAAPLLKQTPLEVIPTGYMLIDCGVPTTASYISNTQPIPYHKPEIAVSTAMAGEMLGLKLMYLDGGSGAAKAISSAMVEQVSAHTDTPLLVGGGIRSIEEAERLWQAGADLLVVGTATEAADGGSLIEQMGRSPYMLQENVSNV